MSKARSIFIPEPSPDCLTVVMDDASNWALFKDKINRRAIADEWKELDFTFEAVGRAAQRVPEITTIYIPGLLAFDARHVDRLFPVLPDDCELLPIRVGGARWLLVNCLCTVDAFVDSTSVVLRDSGGEIYHVVYLEIEGSDAKPSDLFTLRESNRALVFASEALVDRIRDIGLKGLRFRHIGKISF